MKKRIVSYVISVCLCVLAAAGAAGCGGKTSEEEPFVIGMRFPVTIDQMQQQTMDNVTELVESAG